MRRDSRHVEPKGPLEVARHYVRELIYGASDGTSAIRALHDAAPIDVVLLDLRLPDCDDLGLLTNTGPCQRYPGGAHERSTLVTPQQLEPVHNRLHTAATDVRHPLTARLALGVGYRFDHHDVEDFARSPGTLNSPLIPTFMNLMNQWRPYSTHTGFLRLIHTFYEPSFRCGARR